VKELEAEHKAGHLTNEAFAEARAELDYELLSQMTARARPEIGKGRGWAVASVVVALPAAALLIYLQLGAHRDLSASHAQMAMPEGKEAQLAFIRENVDQLEKRLRTDPNGDPQGWVMLGRAYAILERFQDAAQAYGEAYRRIGDDPQLLVDYAEALAYTQGGSLGGRPEKLLEQALAVDQRHAKALWLAGIAAMQSDRPEQARSYWQRLAMLLPPESEVGQQVAKLLAELETGGSEQSPGGGSVPSAKLKVEVSLHPAFSEWVKPDDTVFVLARAAQGPRTPLAVQRYRVRDLPVRLILDDSMAMMPSMTLSHFQEVVVEARVSKSGKPAIASGDLQGISAQVTVAGAAPVYIVISNVVP
jgi:cytochrome c-type biogenesis protein CcmH